MNTRLRTSAFAALAVGALAIGVPVASASLHGGGSGPPGHHGHAADPGGPGGPGGRGGRGGRGDPGGPGGPGGGADAIKHVLLLSVDGLHQSDLDWYVANHPGSELAKLVNGGADYTSAHTPIPSDSDPGMTAQLTGGDPGTTGVYYDNTYNHDMFAPGTTTCTGTPPGSAVIYDSPDDVDGGTSLDAGQGLSGLPGSILHMTGQPQTLLNPATFPVDPKTCKPVFPNQYLKVNMVFNVAHSAGLVTAWSDKHPVYTSFDGPAGNGITDSFDPEIDSTALQPDGTPYPGGISWTDDNAATMQYDSYKVGAVLNWIDGFDHSGTDMIGTPSIFGMNFQTVSTAEKLPSSDGLQGGDLPGTTTPGPLLARAMQYIDDQVQRMADQIQARGLENSTAIILSAKHGQSPQNPDQLTRIDDGPIIDGVNKAWAATHPGAQPLVVFDTDDDAIMWWLSDRSPQAARFVRHYLWTHSATGNTVSGGTRTLPHSGLVKIYAGKSAARYFGVPQSDPRHPDVWGVVKVGVVYTGGTAKIAEHGGANPADRDVPIVVYAPGSVHHQVSDRWVETTQIAPTMLRLLGLDPGALQAVQIQHTQVLPGIERR
ncbi:MAG TPA: alkaline phosphatase family protein [Solirubrobacteraceae bacterium]|nr:alkaline phosphatase family protein [Solirubrobacteraceae bacterium]